MLLMLLTRTSVALLEIQLPLTPEQKKLTTPAGQKFQFLFVLWRRLCCLKFQVPQAIVRDSIVPVLVLITSVWLHILLLHSFPYEA